MSNLTKAKVVELIDLGFNSEKLIELGVPLEMIADALLSKTGGSKTKAKGKAGKKAVERTYSVEVSDYKGTKCLVVESRDSENGKRRSFFGPSKAAAILHLIGLENGEELLKQTVEGKLPETL